MAISQPLEMIHLDRVDSTNTFLKQLSLKRHISDFLTVTSKAQWNGRGQYGNVWHAKPGENITCSVYRHINNRLELPFLMMSVSLALHGILAKHLEYCTIKWPNDIFIRDKKISGILIETISHKSHIGVIVGIGINVNQTHFGDLSQATSLKLITGKTYDLHDILTHLIQKMRSRDLKVDINNYNYLKRQYEALLYKKDRVHGFSDIRGDIFNGIIKGISDKGLLRVLLENDQIREYDTKQIRF